MECSIIICTRNRASRLAETLGSFANVRIPDGWQVEMIVADNGSTDDTAEVVANTAIPGIQIRHLFVAQPGKSRAQNAAVAVADGTALLFTDDDVELSEDWLDLMARPLLEGRCDAVGGRISLAGELRRPWMGFQHLLWLADVPSPASDDFGLVGANMGIHRSVFGKTGFFDVNLGPGASGFGEETLLWRQMLAAGMSVMPVIASHVVHRPDSSRLHRAGWLAAARNFGRTRAYLMHHWEYVELSFPRATRWWNLLKLHLRNPLRFLSRPDKEGCPSWEMSYLVNIACCETYLQESVKPRKYPFSAKFENTLAISEGAGQSCN